MLIALGVITTALAVNFWVWKNTPDLPQIEGVFIPAPRPLANFILQDQYNQAFSNQQLQGHWNLLAYGFTNCPDFCPTLLTELAKVTDKLQQQQQFDDLQVIFYSIDPERDGSEQLAQYMAHFNSDFIGLRRQTKEATLLPTTPAINTATNQPTNVAAASRPDPTDWTAFEKSLGIVYSRSPEAGSAGPEEQDPFYSVAHGTMMYLINPNGELQAILRPQSSADGVASFAAEQVYQDYIAVRRYADTASSNRRTLSH
ncbi:SCO family protein [Aestuariicella hydrocarbonica]|uniref:SCO family protein n=1 Tax=Pseudomaricurvus hydrocarbonicus TaxID=1470433 RepID=A0A9E5T1R0_9GAMM|nr:SCO family protein [Aestuariicella hydrocarbonica]NHO67021.1 SCO family protein [Aestuariicella hydrocarbonica]